MPLHPIEVRGSRFRNVNSVARKTADIATNHPAYTGGATKGGKTTLEVIHDFLKRPEMMAAAARAIRAGVESGEFEALPELPDEQDLELSEGRLLLRRYYARERSPQLRNKKIVAFLKQHDRVSCEACSFDFEAVYGTRGARYIECHHAVPLHVSGETTTGLDDLVLLCANCHRMIHRQTPWLTPEQLRGLIRITGDD